MLGITILNIKIIVKTSVGRFFVDIPFEPGLNIIRAENSSGKSTCINAIAYGLGLEAILGPSRKRPFPKSLYDLISENKKDDTSDKNLHRVKSSKLSISIKNNSGIEALLTRDIKGNDNKVSILSEFNGGDYFLGSAGNTGIGSAISSKGFHHWLAKFIGWNLPNVVAYDGSEKKLYLECIFPLFFIEQKRGWSEIQANIPSNYGIKNVKKVAIEFCLNIDTFEYEKKLTKLKNAISSAKSEWSNLQSIAESIADFNSVKVNNFSDLNDEDSQYHLEFSYIENEILIGVSEQKKSLSRLISKLSKEIIDITPNDERLVSLEVTIRNLRQKRFKNSESLETTLLSISSMERKISSINQDLDQYRQLLKLKKVGSEFELDNKECPICGNDLYDTLDSNSTNRQPMSLEENIDFLKNQLDFYQSIKDQSDITLKEYYKKSKLLTQRLKVEHKKLLDIKSELRDINGESNAIFKEKIQAEVQLQAVLKLLESKNNLSEQAKRIYSKWSTSTEALRIAKKKNIVSNKASTLEKLEKIIRTNLTSFKFKRSDIKNVSISHHSLRPEQEGYDIVAETSASDYIRIIWAYTLALLEISNNEEKIKHSGFVVFDEPRQHEASMVSFTNLIDKSSETLSYGGQVIFATSLDENVIRNSCIDKDINLKCFDDYILKLETETLD
jgi:predicted ATPase